MARRFPPGPIDRFLGIRSLGRMKADVLDWYSSLRRDFGDSVSYTLGPYRFFVFFHPEQVREILITQAKSFIRFPRAMRVFSQWNGNSLLITEGEAWARQRRLVQPAFQPKRIAAYADGIMKSTTKMLETLRPEIASHGFADFDVNPTMTSLTLEIICRALFDSDVTEATTDISKAVAILSEIAYFEMQAPLRWPIWLPTPTNRRKRWAMHVLDSTIWRFVRQRRSEKRDHGDLLSMLLASVDSESNTGGLTDRQVRDEATTLMLAGHDTSAAALNWVLYLLAKNPDAQQKCRAEIGEKDGDSCLAGMNAGDFCFLEACIKEALRIYPPAVLMFLRQPTKDLVIGGYDVPAGSLVSVCPYVTQRDPRWFPAPLDFVPDRFLGTREESIPACAYFPFGAGPRVCIGQGLAMLEMMLIVATILRDYEISLIPGEPEPVPFVHVALRPVRPLRLRLHPAASKSSNI